MQKHYAEPVTRELVRWWCLEDRKRAAKKMENPEELVRMADDDWDDMLAYDAPREKVILYFSIATPVLALFGGICSALFMAIFMISLFTPSGPNFWILTPLLPAAIFYSLSLGNNLERAKSLKNETYMGYFDSAKFTFFTTLGTLAFSLLVLGATYVF